MAEKTTFNYKIADELTYYVTRWQLPLLPAYAFTVNKIQGQSLKKVIVDLQSAKALYVMISRATALDNLVVLRWFPSTNVDR
jgi:ATP-dependent exoDNAse (exonuclease V) alpha subunit